MLCYLCVERLTILASCLAVVARNKNPVPGNPIPLRCNLVLQKVRGEVGVALFDWPLLEFALVVGMEHGYCTCTEHRLDPPPPCFVLCFWGPFIRLILLKLGSYLGQSALRMSKISVNVALQTNETFLGLHGDTAS